MTISIPNTEQPRVVIIGGGFGGIQLAQKLTKKAFQVVLIDKNNYHTFQPLLYQVATGGLEPDSIAHPIRRMFENRKNFYFRLGEVKKIDPENRNVQTSIGQITYDYLVIATGSTNNFFNLAPKQDMMMTLKSVRESLDLRSLLLQNMEKALLTKDEEVRSALLNVVIVGAGPSGVELAGAISEMRKWLLPKDYPEIDFSQMEIYLFEMADSVLSPMSAKASEKAEKYLRQMDVNVRLNEAITDYDGKKAISDNGEEISTETFIWTAGVKGAAINGIPEDLISKGNRISVDEFNRVKGFDNVFAIGDVALQTNEGFEEGLPMLAPVAMQQGKHLAKNLQRLKVNNPMTPFKYLDKGAMATIGRNKAVADVYKTTLGGFVAWFIWMFVHILQLIGFRNKAIVFIDWAWNYFTYDRALRLIIRPYVRPGTDKIITHDPAVAAKEEEAV